VLWEFAASVSEADVVAQPRLGGSLARIALTASYTGSCCLLDRLSPKLLQGFILAQERPCCLSGAAGHHG